MARRSYAIFNTVANCTDMRAVRNWTEYHPGVPGIQHKSLAGKKVHPLLSSV